MSLRYVDGKLSAFNCLELFVNNLLSIDARDMQPPPLDASGYDESNKLCLIFVRPLGKELSSF